MKKIIKRELEGKIKTPKKFKVVTLKTSYIKLEENFNDVYNEIEGVLDRNSDFFSSYDISQSIDDITMSPMIHIILYREDKIDEEKIIKTSPRMLCSWCFTEKCKGHNFLSRFFKWFKK
jgi:hypothetical protein